MNKTTKLMLSLATALLLMLLSACGDVAEQNALDSQIVGGSKAKAGAYPFVVKLKFEGAFDCGGVLVEREWVLTAAHCVNKGSASDFQVVLGEHKRGENEGTEQKIGVKNIKIHPEFKDINNGPDENDIALLKLKKSANLNDQVSRITTRGVPSNGTTLRVAGWGLKKEDGSASKTLRQVDVPVVSKSECKEAYSDKDILGSMLCAGFSEGGKDACSGDSGGPIFKGNRLVGLVSWGQGCARADKYGVYTKVSSFDNWINSNIN